MFKWVITLRGGVYFFAGFSRVCCEYKDDNLTSSLKEIEPRQVYHGCFHNFLLRGWIYVYVYSSPENNLQLKIWKLWILTSYHASDIKTQRLFLSKIWWCSSLSLKMIPTTCAAWVIIPLSTKDATTTKNYLKAKTYAIFFYTLSHLNTWHCRWNKFHPIWE